MNWKSFLSVFLLSSLSYAHNEINSMEPLDDELLPEPIELQCGLKVVESTPGFYLSEKELNEHCNLAIKAFPAFLMKEKGIKRKHTMEFMWDASFILEGTCFRCLNDMEYRFENRQINESLSGYTNYLISFLFVGIDREDFYTAFVHELYHALSSYYDVLFNAEEDERLARKFTYILGLGI